MNALETLYYDGAGVRVFLVDGEPWFSAADVCTVLEIGNPSQAMTRLDEDEYTLISNEGFPVPINAVSEAGLFSLILGSRKPEARAFKRWVTHEVLPAIRRTGSYTVESPEQLMARAVLQAQELLARRDQQVAELTPRAEAWDELASAEGDYSVADAAKMLARAGVKTGPQRLFEQLAAMRWIFRAHDRRWRVYAGTVDSGYLAEKISPPRRDRITDELIAVPPQVRVTARGLERLRVRLGTIETGAAA